MHPPAVGVRVTPNFQIGVAYVRSFHQQDGWHRAARPSDTLVLPADLVYKVDSR